MSHPIRSVAELDQPHLHLIVRDKSYDVLGHKKLGVSCRLLDVFRVKACKFFLAGSKPGNGGNVDGCCPVGAVTKVPLNTYAKH